MREPLSICIPAHNEQRTIARTLDSLLAQDLPEGSRIIVCANACDDGTEREVERVCASSRTGIELISEPHRGKAHAWNVLFAAASHRQVCFADADVLVPAGSLAALQDELAQGGYAAVGATMAPLLDGCSLLTRLSTSPAVPQGCLNGRLYLLDAQRVREALERKGFSSMPEVLYEDVWLTGALGRGNWKVSSRAKVLYSPCAWEERPAIEARDIVAKRQIADRYPGIALEIDSAASFRGRLARMGEKLRAASLRDLPALFCEPVLKAYVATRARALVREGEVTGWVIARSSKSLPGPQAGYAPRAVKNSL